MPTKIILEKDEFSNYTIDDHKFEPFSNRNFSAINLEEQPLSVD
jgi:hypothetical protein